MSHGSRNQLVVSYQSDEYRNDYFYILAEVLMENVLYISSWFSFCPLLWGNEGNQGSSGSKFRHSNTSVGVVKQFISENRDPSTCFIRKILEFGELCTKGNEPLPCTYFCSTQAYA